MPKRVGNIIYKDNANLFPWIGDHWDLGKDVKGTLHHPPKPDIFNSLYKN